ncbi:AMP-binding protein [Mycobacterium kansasii]|uniref:Fatty-acid--CoA ligase fadD21 n=3 Tax=Mycobacterium kansasii TaxID=1768 RepID=A0A653EZE5_MYCKA|nr:AMP-binding protein [Mycobacterium kansasii]ARG56383.1 long-chain acyl-CoA synthetase [Mycobacterium kansasii]ARG61833.1 long-chain acyl-CoA synthetase [Mycobacterium kansasii]ARG69520.1 long-chain acyl-CoA synthetase [Mycobacterium kansasii]ARG75863.1 long-chain acyl-CoA synthetase [Mycobacterium kansasii]ARG81401.1 long-chain acyl-CoA synthetase [Mycobacterium kansasii]
MSLLLDQVRELGARIPDATAISFVNERGRVTESMTRADVVTEMNEVADLLWQRCGLAPGDRAVLVYPPGLDFVRGLVGCLAAGVLPVPIYPPDPINPQNSIEGFQRVVADCGAKVVLTSRRYTGARWLGAAKSFVAGSSVDWPSDLPWQVTSRGIGSRRTRGFDSSPRTAHEWAPSRDTPALLQYTSGSTSDPKGVVITHGNLAHQFELNRRLLGLGLETRGVFWLPPYHDFGLISVILSTLTGNSELTMMSPLSFIQRPALWFDVMNRVRATHTAAPNFAYDLAVHKTTTEQRAQWDLSSLKVVMSAAEPVREETKRRFLEAFAVTGLRPEAFCPAYGLAEHTVAVTIFGRSTLRVDRHQLEMERRAVPADGADSQVLVSCGELTGDVDVRIVDPELCVGLSDGQVGEIWVDSPSKAAGYWGSPDESRATFAARLTGMNDGHSYLRTGDLGFLHDGELYVCGRVKDLLIVAGRNIHPQDVEDTLRNCHRAIRPGGIAAFAIDAGNTEALAVLVEVRADASRAVLSSVVEKVRAVVLKNHQLRCSAVVVGPPGSVSKTTSGKVQRSRCRARWLDGSLEAQALLVERFEDEEPMDAGSAEAREGEVGASGRMMAPIARNEAQTTDELLAMVRGQVAAVFGIGVANVDIDQPLGAQGLNSVGFVMLASRLSQVVGREVPPMEVFNHPSVRGLATMLSDGEGRNPGQRLPGNLKQHCVPSRFSLAADSPEALIEDSFEALLKEAVAADKIGEGLQLLRAASQLRLAVQSRYDTRTRSLPTPTTFSRGPNSPHLIFICTSVFSSGVHNYARIASEFKGTRNVSAVPLPGFSRGEPLPITPEAGVESLAQIVVELVGDEPFVLAGQSSGGKFAYALGKYFEDVQNSNFAGVVLLDTHMGSDPEAAELLTKEILIDVYGENHGLDLFHATRITAVIQWSDMLPALYDGPLEAGVLFVQCTRPWIMPYGSGNLEYPLTEPWSSSHTVRTVPVNHISILSEGAQSAAQIIEEWIRKD